jgi:hypothetical protein
MAGLLDTDGCWSGNRFVYCSVIERLAREVKQLGDQLGFRCALRRNSADCAWEVTLGGDTWRIPTKIKRKQSSVRSLGRSRLNSTLCVTSEGSGEFAGFETDGDHQFLLADGTVTHNCQLPPVSKDTPQQFAFQSQAWTTADIRVALLTKVFRQSDRAFSEALNRIRVGELCDDTIALLRSRVKAPDPDPTVEPVTVYTHNEDVERLNHRRLAQIDAEERSWEATDWGEAGALRTIQKNCLAPAQLKLKPGAQVMLLWNIDTESGLANGSIGVVESFSQHTQLPIVKFLNGERSEIEKRSWEIKTGGAILASRTQIPLRLAYAITAHKSQGMTLDKIRVHLDRAFEYGQSYVALSRARTLEGLFIESTKAGCIKAHPAAVEFYERCAKLGPLTRDKRDDELF